MANSISLSRRHFLAGASSLMALSLAGCSTSKNDTLQQQATLPPPILPEVVAMYASLPEEKFPVPPVDLRYLDQRFYRRRVGYLTPEEPGTIVVDTATYYLYHVEDGGTAMRYGAGLGRAGFAWSGRGRIAYSREWPVWTPPQEMIERQPELEKWSNGQPPGLDNPLGARALYIHQGSRDTLYRIHGTGEAWTIGRAVSSGCVRLLHHDVIHLADRVKWGSPIVVS
jgi:lipoprotein-anchoring transpeptidase ErfK/SrfK